MPIRDTSTDFDARARARARARRYRAPSLIGRAHRRTCQHFRGAAVVGRSPRAFCARPPERALEADGLDASR